MDERYAETLRKQEAKKREIQGNKNSYHHYSSTNSTKGFSMDDIDNSNDVVMEKKY